MEEASELKHMYYAGDVTAMAGGSYEHGRIAMNLGIEIGGALRDRDCAVLGSDVLLQTGSQDMMVYPDLMVMSGPVARMQGRPSVVTNPLFIVEVLSPSTEAKDRGDKSHEYRITPSVRQYALVSQDKARVELHTRAGDGTWILTEVSGLAGNVELASLGCQVPMAAIYRGVLDA